MIDKTQRFLVTGAAGFIGAAVCESLIAQGHYVVGMDNMNDYYDPTLKQGRLDRISAHANSQNFSFVRCDLADKEAIFKLVKDSNPHVVINLAAQASVRYDNPEAYLNSNLVGFLNLLEAIRHEADHSGTFKQLVYASTSSVYGGDKDTPVPFVEDQFKNQPKSLYAATKCANESMAHAYSHLYKFKCTGLRFFTVYGPWGRPDMAPIMFAKSITEGKTIRVFNHGDLQRDFTFVNDIVEGVIRLSHFEPDVLHDVYNIGNGSPVELMDFIRTLEKLVGKKAVLEMVDMPPAEQYINYADTSKLKNAVGYQPQTKLEDGLAKFVDWFKDWYGTA